jgi:hypothetical protein
MTTTNLAEQVSDNEIVHIRDLKAQTQSLEARVEKLFSMAKMAAGKKTPVPFDEEPEVVSKLSVPYLNDNLPIRPCLPNQVAYMGIFTSTQVPLAAGSTLWPCL